MGAAVAALPKKIFHCTALPCTALLHGAWWRESEQQKFFLSYGVRYFAILKLVNHISNTFDFLVKISKKIVMFFNRLVISYGWIWNMGEIYVEIWIIGEIYVYTWIMGESELWLRFMCNEYELWVGGSHIDRQTNGHTH